MERTKEKILADLRKKIANKKTAHGTIKVNTEGCDDWGLVTQDILDAAESIGCTSINIDGTYIVIKY